MASIYKRGKIWWIKYHVKGTGVQRSLHTTNERVAKTRQSKLEYDLSYLRTFGPICTDLMPGNTCNRSKILRKDDPRLQEPLKSRHVHEIIRAQGQ